MKVLLIFFFKNWWDQNIFKDLSKILNLPDERIYRAKQVHGRDIIIIDNQDNKNPI